MNVVLMAGGGGTRLWPLSRISRPKQFIDFGSGKTLIELAYQRALKLTASDNIFVATSQTYEARVRELLPDVVEDHVYLESERRDTTAAFASIALRLVHAGLGDTPTIFLWSDHVFSDENSFVADLKLVPGLVEKYSDSLIILGHKPVSPETVLGYMEVGEPVEAYSNVFQLKKFTEKPNKKTAESFIAAGNYYWNLGYFSMKPSYLLRELQEQSPETKKPIAEFANALKTRDDAQIESAYAKFPKISIEYTLIEKTKRIIAVTGDYGWSDVGGWSAVKDVFGRSGDHVPKGHHIHVDSKDNYIYNATDMAVSMIGMEDTIVVVTPDAVLVTNKEDSHKVKEVVARLEQEGSDKLL